MAEVDDGDAAPVQVPSRLEVIADVSRDEAWTGGALAVRLGRQEPGDLPASSARSRHHDNRPGRPS